jgi:hypothetical protein
LVNAEMGRPSGMDSFGSGYSSMGTRWNCRRRRIRIKRMLHARTRATTPPMTTPMMAPVERPVLGDGVAGRELRDGDGVDEADDVGREEERAGRETFPGRFTSELRKRR